MERFEVEIKARCKSRKSIIKLLNCKKALRIKKLTEEDTYFNHPAKDFKDTDEALRLRLSEGRAILTYKGPKLAKSSKVSAKARTELETEIGDCEVAAHILSALGFTASGKVFKERELYRLDDAAICLDSVQGLGLFAEIEKIGSDREKLEAEVLALAEEFKLTNNIEPRSYLELVLAKNESGAGLPDE